MKQICYVTSNKAKFAMVAEFLAKRDPHSFELVHAPLDMPEEQSLDMKAIAEQKAQYAYDRLKQPLIVEDTGIYFESCNQFPGTLTKFVYHGIGIEGILKLTTPNNRAYWQMCMVFHDGTTIHHFTVIEHGTIIPPAAPIPAGHTMPYSFLFLPNGAPTVHALLPAELKTGKYNHRLKAFEQFLESNALKKVLASGQF